MLRASLSARRAVGRHVCCCAKRGLGGVCWPQLQCSPFRNMRKSLFAYVHFATLPPSSLNSSKESGIWEGPWHLSQGRSRRKGKGHCLDVRSPVPSQKRNLRMCCWRICESRCLKAVSATLPLYFLPADYLPAGHCLQIRTCTSSLLFSPSFLPPFSKPLFFPIYSIKLPAFFKDLASCLCVCGQDRR